MTAHTSAVTQRRIAARAAATLFVVVATTLGAMTAAVAQTDDAAIRSFYSALEKSMKAGGTAQSRFTALKPVIEKTFDLPEMSKAAVGPAWDKLSDEQRSAITAAFSDFTVAQFAKLFDKYTDETFEVGKSAGGVVESKISSGSKATSISYKMSGGRIQDVYLNKTISEIASRRAEFTAVLGSGGPPQLIKTLKDRTAKLLAG